MNRLRKQTHWIALIALVLVFAGCKGESPTAPPSTGGGNPGGVTPPTGATVTVAASSTDLEVDQTSIITVTVTQNGSPVPNGTAVEFLSNIGTFADTGTNATIRTTTNGVATASLSSASAGTAVVTVTVNNVTKNSPSITFRARPVTTPQPSTDPTITSITPSFGLPSGGELLKITGTNFRGRVRVFFDIPGEATPREAFVTSQSATEITVVTPNVQLAPGQELSVPIRVVVDADTATQKTVTAPSNFVFKTVVLTPTIVTVSPNSGPINGGTRVTLFGNGFQAPVQVLFGSAEARVVGDVRFDSIIIETPPAHDALGDIGTTGTADITVININSNTRATLSPGFHYTPSMAITAITPFSGPALGGTDITINGLGLDGRLQVVVGGIEAQVIRASGTSVLVRTNPATNPCGNTSGSIVVTNIDTGVSATSTQSFTYLGVGPRILSVSGPVAAGANTTVNVSNPGVGALGFGDIKFTVNGVNVIPSPAQVTSGTTTTSFTVPTPSTGYTFPTVQCTTTVGGLSGTQLGNTTVPIIFTNIQTGCTDSSTVTITPPPPNTCLTPPRPTVTNPAGGSCATPPPAGVTIAPLTTTAPITISNGTEAQPLNITAVAISGTNASEFTINPTSASNIAAGGNANFTLTFDPTSIGPKSATVTFTTNSTITPTLTVCVQATANP